MGVGVIGHTGFSSRVAVFPAAVPIVCGTGQGKPPPSPGSAHIPSSSAPASGSVSDAGSLPPRRLSLEWVQHLYSAVITFSRTSYRLVGQDVPEVLQSPTTNPRKRRVEDLLVALMYYSLNLYISDVVTALVEQRRAIISENSANPQKELYDNLLGTRPPVPWIIHAIASQQLAALSSQSSDEGREFFERTGNFTEVRDLLLRGYRCVLVPTEGDFGPLPLTDPPTEAALRARIAQIPPRLRGSFPYARRLRKLLSHSRLPDVVRPIVRELVRPLRDKGGNTIIPRAEDIPFLSLFLLYNPRGDPVLDGRSSLAVLYRVMIEQQLLRTYVDWAHVSPQQIAEGLLTARRVVLIFATVTHITGREERNPARFFHFLGKAYALEFAHIRELAELADRRDFRTTLSHWKALTRTT